MKKVKWIDEQVVSSKDVQYRIAAVVSLTLSIVSRALQHLPGSFWSSKHQDAVLHQSHPWRHHSRPAEFVPVAVRFASAATTCETMVSD